MLLVSRYVTGFSLCYWFLVMLLVSGLCVFVLFYGFIGCLYSMFVAFFQIYYTMMGRTGCGRSLLTKSDSG